MISISLCMIVRDEEEVLDNCLSSVSGIVDEIIVVDTGSKDNTKDIAAEHEAKIYDFAWRDDFAAARNYAFSKATKEYIFWLDADDVINSKNKEKLKNLKQTLRSDVDSIAMDYCLSFDVHGKPNISLKRNRLVRRSCNFEWIGVVHEYLAVSGNIMQTDIAIHHSKIKEYTDRNLRIYRTLQSQNKEFSVRDLYYFANELRENAYYEEAVEYYNRFLQTQQGWVEDNISTCLKLADCFSHLRESINEYDALVRSFLYDLPRAEVCCRLGMYFFQKNNLNHAIYWYKTATQLGEPPKIMGTLDMTAWTWLPHLQLCVCYDRIGNNEKAEEHNDRALAYHPTHPSMLHNQKYFDGLNNNAKKDKNEQETSFSESSESNKYAELISKNITKKNTREKDDKKTEIKDKDKKNSEDDSSSFIDGANSKKDILNQLTQKLQDSYSTLDEDTLHKTLETAKKYFIDKSQDWLPEQKDSSDSKKKFTWEQVRNALSFAKKAILRSSFSNDSLLGKDFKSHDFPNKNDDTDNDDKEQQDGMRKNNMDSKEMNKKSGSLGNYKNKKNSDESYISFNLDNDDFSNNNDEGIDNIDSLKILNDIEDDEMDFQELSESTSDENNIEKDDFDFSNDKSSFSDSKWRLNDISDFDEEIETNDQKTGKTKVLKINKDKSLKDDIKLSKEEDSKSELTKDKKDSKSELTKDKKDSKSELSKDKLFKCNMKSIKETDNKVDLDKETDNKVDLDKETDNKVDLDKETDNKVDLDKETDNKVDLDKETDNNSDLDKETDNNSDLDKETDNNSDLDKETDNDSDLDKEIDNDSDLDKEIDNDSDLDKEIDNDSDLDKEIDNDSDLDKETDNNSDLDKEIDNKVDLDKETDNKVDLDKETDNKVDLDKETDNKVDLDKETDNKVDLDKETDNKVDLDKETDSKKRGLNRGKSRNKKSGYNKNK